MELIMNHYRYLTLSLSLLLCQAACGMNYPMNYPLHDAAMNGYTETVRLLLEHGADINCTDNSGYRPLHYAAMNGNTETVRLLLDRGADKETETNRSHQRTALQIAASARGAVRQDHDLTNVRALLQAGASLHTSSEAEGSDHRPLDPFPRDTSGITLDLFR